MKTKPRIYINAPLPDYSYVLRWWLADDEDPHGTQSQVLVIRSDHPLTMSALKTRVEAIGANPKNFVLVDVPRGGTAKLDTWEAMIQGGVFLVGNWQDDAPETFAGSGDAHEI